MNINIGIRIKELRKKNQFSISQLSKKSGVSTGLISQVERNLVTPSVENLWKIAQALNVKVGYFFEENSKDKNLIVRKSERKVIKFNEGNAIYQQLTPNIEKDLEFYEITVKAGKESAADFVRHEGVECGVMLQGSLDVIIGVDTYHLEEGDSIYFESSLPHKFINNGNNDCLSLWVMTPASF